MKTSKTAIFFWILFGIPLLAGAQALVPSHPSGFYPEAFYLFIDSPYDLRYTLNGNTPRPDGTPFPDSLAIGQVLPPNNYCLIPTNNIEYGKHDWRAREFGWRAPKSEVEKLICIRVAGFQYGRKVTDELVLVYGLGERSRNLPVISLVTDSMNLFDEEIGIMVPGIWYDPDNPYWSGNYCMTGSIWERPAVLSYILPDGTQALSQQVGLRIHGGGSRVAPQKSLRIYADESYGPEQLSYPFFGSSGFADYKRLIVRSAMTFWYERNAVFQDEYLQALVGGFYPDLDVMDWQASELYINGEHWGLVSLRERQDEYYVSQHHGLSPQEVQLIEPTVDRVYEFDRILDLCRHEDLNLEENYRQLQQWMDMENYVRYMLIELFFSNEDWPNNNSKAWRHWDEEGKWKWLLYDLDACLARPGTNSLDLLFDSEAPLAVIFKAVMHQPEFLELLEREWVRMRDQLLVAERMGPLLARFIEAYEPGIEPHIVRWGNPVSVQNWQEDVNAMFGVLLDRREAFDTQIRERFNWSNQSDDTVSMADEWLVYPNPVADVLNISSENMLQFAWRVQLRTTEGRLLYDQQVSRQSFRMPMADLKPGLYLLTIESNLNRFTSRILKL